MEWISGRKVCKWDFGVGDTGGEVITVVLLLECLVLLVFVSS